MNVQRYNGRYVTEYDQFCSAPVYVAASDYDDLAARLAEAERLIRHTLSMHDDCICRDRRKAFSEWLSLGASGSLPK